MKNRGRYVRKDLGIYTLSNTRTGVDLNLGTGRVGRVRVPVPDDRARPAGVLHPPRGTRLSLPWSSASAEHSGDECRDKDR